MQLKSALRGRDFVTQMKTLEPIQRRKAAEALQLKGGGTDAIHEAAAAGTASGGGAMPYASQIQKSFGRHDVSNVQAHTGGAATQASEAMGASAYASGNHVAFAGTPDLHTAAHEAAHVVQQSAGVSLAGGVGQTGDRYEQHADQVADAVVSGKSAEGILDKMAGGGGGGSVQKKAVVQRDGPNRSMPDGSASDGNASYAPPSGGGSSGGSAGGSTPAHGGGGEGGGLYTDQSGVGDLSTQGEVGHHGPTVGVSTANGGTISAGREWPIWPPGGGEGFVPRAPIPGAPGFWLTARPSVKVVAEAAISGLTAGESEREYRLALTGSLGMNIEFGEPSIASIYFGVAPTVTGGIAAKFDHEGLKSVEGDVKIDSFVNVGIQAAGGFDYHLNLARTNIGRFVGFHYQRGGTTRYGEFQPGPSLAEALRWAKAAAAWISDVAGGIARGARRVASNVSSAWAWIREHT